MNSFDFEIIAYVNQFSQHSRMFDNLVRFLSDNHLLKGGVLTIIIWWAWFHIDERRSHDREHIISTLLSCFVAMQLARALALTLPFRIRPLHEEYLSFLLPYGMTPTALEGWSSFPSDHAVLFFTLSTGLVFISKKVGIFALFYTTLFIAFPRIYLGLHYLTDIIAGAIIGITIALLGNMYLCKVISLQKIVSWSHSKPSLFYPLFFLLTYQIADMFDGIRAISKAGFKLFQTVFA
jgi:undecaprenyl-diphosphatase